MAEDLLEDIEEEQEESVESAKGSAKGDDAEKKEAAQEISLDDDGEGTGEEPAKKGLIGKLLSSKKKLIIIILLALFLLGGTGVGLLLFLSGGEEEEPVAEQPVSEDTVTEESIQAALEDQSKVIFEDIVQLEPFEQIFLQQSSHKQYISLGISLEMMEPGLRRQVYTMEPRIRKIIESQMRQMKWMELRSPQGKLKLKFTLLNRINQIFPKVAIRHIYFTNFIMQ